MKLVTIDWLILVLYFGFIFSIGFYFLRRQISPDQYFLAGRSSKWYTIGPSVFAANISSEHLIGLAGSGAAMGLAVGAYEWMAVFCLFILGWLFVPYYFNSKIFTMPEFLERRFNSGCRWYLSIMSILAYIFTKISVALFAGSILLKVVLDWDPFTSVVVLVIAAGIYTALGGLSAIIWADLIQTIIIIIGAFLLTLIGLLPFLLILIIPHSFSIFKCFEIAGRLILKFSATEFTVNVSSASSSIISLLTGSAIAWKTSLLINISN